MLAYSFIKEKTRNGLKNPFRVLSKGCEGIKQAETLPVNLLKNETAVT